MKKIFSFILVLSVLGTVIGCGSSSETVQSGESKPTVDTKGKKAGAMETEAGLHPPK